MDNKIKIPNSLIKALKLRQVIPFVGAGVSLAVKKKNDDSTGSKESLFPSWKDYVEILAQTLIDEGKTDDAGLVEAYIKPAKPKYLEAMQHAFEELPKSVWYQTLNEKFKKDESEAAQNSLELPKLVWQLGSNLIFTTNIDRVLEWKSVKEPPIEQLSRQNVEFAELQADKNPPPTIFYLHGRVGDNENIVFTRQQYDDFYKNHKNEVKLRTLQSFLTTRSFLFIGFSLDDAYFVEELKNIRQIYRGGAKQYYALIRKSDAGKLKDFDFVSEVYFEDFGEPLLEVLREMHRIVGETKDEKENENLLLATPEKASKAHFSVPFASKGDAFVGREGLREKIWESLNKSGRAAIGQAVSIEGFGGLGKTQLAVEYAHAHRHKYENGVFWITADEDIDAQLIKIGENLNWISQFDTDFDQVEFVRNCFRKLSKCLIIFDNVDDRNPIEAYLPEKDAHPHILVTSREEQDGFYPISLDILSFNEARELLIKIAEREPNTETEKKALDNILAELDGLPLAVELVGGYLKRRSSISFQDYWEFLQNEPLERLEKRFLDKTFTEHNKSIIRTLQISERLFSEAQYLEEILDILAWSGKSSMGYSLLHTLVGIEDKFAIKDALGVALELRFIKQEEDSERYSIHRLLAKVRRHEKPITKRKQWHQKVAKRVENWFDARRNQISYLNEFEAELEHLQEWQEQKLKYLLDLNRENYQKAKNDYEPSLKFIREDNPLSLSPFSWLYGKIANLRNTLYEKGTFKSFPLGAPTISIGNITAGGTGKTPLVAFVAEILAEKGEKVCILTRGYGRENPNHRVLVSDGENVLADVKAAGDEPFELAQKLLGKAFVIADANRVAAANWALKKFGITAFVLDDAFQHRRVQRDLDIVCVDATTPFGGGRVFLREPLENLKRANIIVVTRANLVKDISDLKSEISNFHPDCFIFSAKNRISNLIELEEFYKKIQSQQKIFDYKSMSTEKCLSFCALGNPDNFFEQLNREGFNLVSTQKFPDHHFYIQNDIERLEEKAKQRGAGILLTTAKDAVKLKNLRVNLPCFIVESEMIFEDEFAFKKLIANTQQLS